MIKLLAEWAYVLGMPSLLVVGLLLARALHRVADAGRAIGAAMEARGADAEALARMARQVDAIARKVGAE